MRIGRVKAKIRVSDAKKAKERHDKRYKYKHYSYAYQEFLSLENYEIKETIAAITMRNTRGY